MAKEIAELIASTKKLALKFLKPAETNIKISSPEFSKKKFLYSKDGVKISTGSNFDNWILLEISNTVPAFEGTFSSLDLTKGMTDDEIRNEKGMDTLTPDEWIAKTRALVLEQPNGENGHLASNYKSNIDYVRLKSGRVVAVYVSWNADCRHSWDLNAYDLIDYPWHSGFRVFARVA